MKTLMTILKFFGNPDLNTFVFETRALKFKAYTRLILVGLILILVSSIISVIVRILSNVECRPINISFSHLLFVNICFTPIGEESAFRLPLIYNRINFSIAALCISFLGVSYVMSVLPIELSHIIIRVLFSFAISTFVFLLLKRKEINNKFIVLWSKKNKVILAFFLFLFVVRHTDLYVINLITLISLPIILLPQIISGMFLSFIRIRFGFLYSVFFHIFLNTVSTLLQII